MINRTRFVYLPNIGRSRIVEQVPFYRVEKCGGWEMTYLGDKCVGVSGNPVNKELLSWN